MSDSQTVQGFVARIFKNGPYKSRRGGGQYFNYSAKIENREGEELPLFYRFGSQEPSFSEGDYIQFSATPIDDKSARADRDSVKKAKKAPARSEQSSTNVEKGSAPTGGGGRSNYNSDQSRADRAYHAAAGNAVERVALLLEYDALPTVNKKAGEPGKADRFAAINGYIDKFIVQNFRDEFPEGYEDQFRLLAEIVDPRLAPEDIKDTVPEPELEFEDEEESVVEVIGDGGEDDVEFE